LKTLFKYFTIFLLLFNGFGAFYGGISFIIEPSGSLLKMSDSFLENSPFNSYLIPGIVLLCVNGIYNFITLYIFLIKNPNAHLFLGDTRYFIDRMDYSSNDSIATILSLISHSISIHRNLFYPLQFVSQKKPIFNYSLISYPIYHAKNIHFLFYYSFRHFVSLSESTGIQLRVLGIAFHHFYTLNRLVYVS
jgi:hypothetical protein